jgi:hypothetical protein
VSPVFADTIIHTPVIPNYPDTSQVGVCYIVRIDGIPVGSKIRKFPWEEVRLLLTTLLLLSINLYIIGLLYFSSWPSKID